MEEGLDGLGAERKSEREMTNDLLNFKLKRGQKQFVQSGSKEVSRVLLVVQLDINQTWD
jgi:hypothetical protein